jgi:hypothetical protein
MKTFKICVETGPCGGDFYNIIQRAKTLEDAIRIAEKKAIKTANGRGILISPRACCEVVKEDKPVKEPMRNITEIRAEIAALRDAYEAKEDALRAEIEAVRNARGFVPATAKNYPDGYEPGRSGPLDHNGSFRY